MALFFLGDTMMIKEIPVYDRPRERFMKYPIESIQTTELLAIILRTGSKQESVIELAKKVLYSYDDLKELSDTSIKDLMRIKGIGQAKAIELLAAIELGKRVVKSNFIQNVRLQSPEEIYRYLKSELEMKTQEHFVALFLNTKGGLIKKETLFIGSLNSSLVHPREIFKHAVINSAAAMVICHNHPSGDPTPSKADIDITKLLHKNSMMMDIELLDHLIIGKDRYFSFKQKGII